MTSLCSDPRPPVSSPLTPPADCSVPQAGSLHEASGASTLLGFLLYLRLFCCLLLSFLTSEYCNVPGLVLELFSVYTHTLGDLIQALYHPYTDNSRFYISSLSHALELQISYQIACLTSPSDV